MPVAANVGVRSERLLMEKNRLQHEVRWFVGTNMDEPGGM